MLAWGSRFPVFPVLAVFILVTLAPAAGSLQASLKGSAVALTWEGPDGEILGASLDPLPVTRVGYGQVDVFSKHSTYNLSYSPTEHIARTITLQNRESADHLVRCYGFAVRENGSSMFQASWQFESISSTRADWIGTIWVTVYDRLPFIFIGFEMTPTNNKGEEKNSEWVLQLEARDGLFALDGELDASRFGATQNYGWQCEPSQSSRGQALILYGSLSPTSKSSIYWESFVPDARYLKAYKTDDDLAPDGAKVTAAAIYQFLPGFDPAGYADNLQFYSSATEDHTLNGSSALRGTWGGWQFQNAAYLVTADADQAEVAFDGRDDVLYRPTIMVQNIDCALTVDVLNGTTKLVEGVDYGLHRDASNFRCYVTIYRMSGTPQTITIKKGVDVSPPVIAGHRRSLSTVWDHTHVSVSARIWDISGVSEVAIWHNGTGILRRYANGVTNRTGTYSFWLSEGNYSMGDTIQWCFEARDASPQANTGTGPIQTFKVPDYVNLDIAGIYLCDPKGLNPGQDFGHENYQQKFLNILRGQGYPFQFYVLGNLSLDALAEHPILFIASQMIQDSAWDYRQYNETDPVLGTLLRQYLEHGCGDVVFLNPAALWQIRDLLGIGGEWLEIYGLNQQRSATEVTVIVEREVREVTPALGTRITLTDGGWGNDNHIGEGWFLLDTRTGSWGQPVVLVNITVTESGRTYWVPLGYWQTGSATIWLALPKWTTRGADLIGEPHDGRTGWLFRIVEHSLETLSSNRSGKMMPFMARHGAVSYSLNGLRAYMTSEEQQFWIDVLTSIERTRNATGSPLSLSIGAIPLYSPLRPILTDQGAYFWEDDCYNDTGIESDPRLVTGLDPSYAKWFTGGNAEYNARAMNWILNGTRKFIMVYNNTGDGPRLFKIDTDDDLDFSEEKEYRMFEDGWIFLNISGHVVNVTIRGVPWDPDPNMAWTLMVMDDITHQVNTTLFDYINSKDWIRVGIHYPWMATKPSGYHWGRYLDSSAMWSPADQYALSLAYFRDSLRALSAIIDPDQVEAAFSPSEHTVGADYLQGFRDAGMVVCLSNWQAIYGPERHEGRNTSQWFYTMYRGQEGDQGPSNWEPIVHLSGVTARNLGIDIDQGGTNLFPEAALDMAWMNDNGWFTDYSDYSVEVVSIMDAWRFWKSTLWMLGQGSTMHRTRTGLRIVFHQSLDLTGLTWVLPSHNASGLPYLAMYLDGSPVLPDCTQDGYVYWTSTASPGRHVLEIVYGSPRLDRPPSDNDPADIAYTHLSTGNSVTWVIVDWEQAQGSYVIKRDATQVAFGKWTNNHQIAHSVDGLQPGNYTFTIIYWDSRNPRQTDEVRVTVEQQIHELALPCLVLLWLLAPALSDIVDDRS